jgi:methionyl-tRNA formyltransferase
MRVVFMGTPDFAASHLKTLAESNYNVIGVFSQPDRPSGRGRRLSPTPVKQVAIEYGIPVFQPDTVNKGVGVAYLERLRPDLVITVAYGKLLRKRVIDLPVKGCYNVHASLLPKYRGAAPIQRALENGERETGISIFRIDEGMDSGPIALKHAIAITPEDNFGTLIEKLEVLGCTMLKRFMELAERDQVELEPQNGELATLAPKISPEDLELKDFSSPSSVLNKIRAYDPLPGVRTSINGEPVKLFEAKRGNIEYQTSKKKEGEIIKIDASGMIVSCGSGSVIISLVQFSGKKKIRPKDALSGRLLREGLVLGG